MTTRLFEHPLHEFGVSAETYDKILSGAIQKIIVAGQASVDLGSVTFYVPTDDGSRLEATVIETRTKCYGRLGAEDFQMAVDIHDPEFFNYLAGFLPTDDDLVTVAVLDQPRSLYAGEMRLWHLIRTDRAHRDENVACLVWAHSSHEARELASQMSGAENPPRYSRADHRKSPWLDASRSTCELASAPSLSMVLLRVPV